MTKSELVTALARDYPDLPVSEVERAITCVFDAITAQLAAGGRVELRGFGVFYTRPVESRIMRDPRTGASVHMEAKRRPRFKAGKAMRERLKLNGGTE